MADIAMLVAEEYERRTKNCRRIGDGGDEIGVVSSVSFMVKRLDGSSWVRKKIGEDNLEVLGKVLEPKTQVGLAAIDGLFSA